MAATCPSRLRAWKSPWNLRAIQADAAWKQEKATGRGVVVALLDTGLMVAPALTSAPWKNSAKVFNGLDDEGDGYVDDLFGYDFQADSYYCLGDHSEGPTHGSMCGGIIAGRPLNKMKLVTGVAPRARLTVLRGMGYLKSYEYALVHGADVMSMSYTWIHVELGNYRGVYRTAHAHLAAAGIVAVVGRETSPIAPREGKLPCPRTSRA
jgi:subtilisin family serine protease